MSTFFAKATDASRYPVYVGKTPDSLFRACAAAILDNFLVHPQLNRDSIKKIIETHLHYFPPHILSNTTWITPSNHLKILLEKIPMTELIPSLAYTLRQLTIDEMLSNLPHYVHCMKQGEKFVSSDTLRMHNAPISLQCLEALAKSLNMPINLRPLVPGKELSAAPIQYNQKSTHSLTNPAVEIESTADVYRPRPIRHKFFLSDVYDSHPTLTPTERSASLSCSETEALQAHQLQLAQSDERAEKTRSSIDAFLTASDCNTNNLMQLFIEKRNDLGKISEPSIPNSHRRTHEEELRLQLTSAFAYATKNRAQLAAQILEQLGGEDVSEAMSNKM